MANGDNTYSPSIVVPTPQPTTSPTSVVTEVGQISALQVVAPHFTSTNSRPYVVHSEKLEKFSGVASTFKRWQQKM